MDHWTRRDLLRAAAGLFAPWVLQPVKAHASGPSNSTPRIGRILSAQYLEAERRLVLTAEEGPAPLLAEDLILLSRAVLRLGSHEGAILFSMEPVGGQMVPLFSPQVVGPVLDQTVCSLALAECDLFLKEAALGSARHPSSNAGPSEIDLMAADVLRRLRRGEGLSGLTSRVHRIFFVLTLPDDTRLSPDWLTVSYPRAVVDVVPSPGDPQQPSPDQPQQVFADMLKARVAVLTARSDLFGRLMNMFLLLKIADWMVRDIRVPIDRGLLESYATTRRPYPTVPIERASRVVVHRGASTVVTLAGGVLFELNGDVQRQVRDTSASALAPPRFIASRSPNGTDRRPPLLSPEPFESRGRRLLRIDVSELFGLRKPSKGEKA